MFRNINAEQRDWLAWRQHEESLYCFPCRLFWNSVCCRLSTAFKSTLATDECWPASTNWRKLCDMVSEHEKCNGHKEYYLAWRELERRPSLQEGAEYLLEASFKVESYKWYNILK